MKVFFLRWLIYTIALVMTGYLLKGVWFLNWQACVAGALVLGLLNAFVRPVLLFLTLPINILTLGLFTILLNAAIFFSVGYIIPSVMITTLFVAWRIVATSMAHATDAAAATSHHQNDNCPDEREIGKIAPVHVTSPLGVRLCWSSRRVFGMA